MDGFRIVFVLMISFLLVTFLTVSSVLKKICIGLFQKKSAPPRWMGFWKFSREGGSKTLEIQAGGGIKLEKVFCRGHFDR